MPKGKRKERGIYKERKNQLPVASDDETETLDTVSAISSISDQQATITDGSTDVEADETTVQENLEEKLQSFIEGISQKSAKGRIESLHSLGAILSQKYLIEIISQNKMTITDCLERSLKKGSGEEKSTAALCSILILIQLGASEDREEVFKLLYPILKVILSDASMPLMARASCAEALGLCTFIAAEETKVFEDTITFLENIFKLAFGKTPQNNAADFYMLMNSAVAAWTLLLSVASDSFTLSSREIHLCKLFDLLSSTDMELRITAGAAIALIYERAREIDEEFESERFDDLCISLKGLSTECNKYRAKKDRRQQKSSFREILSFVEKGNFCEHCIKVNAFDMVIIETWALQTQYNALCHVLGSGMNVHLQENQLLRDIFDLGPPIPLDSVPNSKCSKRERHMIHDAAFKARTKNRKRMRDIKAVVATGE